MEENFDRQLHLTDENGINVTLNVIDILDENEFKKDFIIYTIEGNDDVVYASILNEKEDTYSVDAIEDDREMDYVNKYIDEILNEEE